MTDVKRVTKFYCDVLGFRVSDWMADYFSFRRDSASSRAPRTRV